MKTIEISDDPARLDLDLIHDFLTEHAYWSRGIDRATVERSIANSLCFGVYCDGSQIGFARVITDRATFAYLCDVFVLPAARGQGIAQRLMANINAHPDLQRLRRFALATADAHGLYQRFGFRPVAQQRWMERHDPDVYSRTT